MKEIDVAQFTRNDALADGLVCHLVVKSLDQTARRRRMIEAKKRGTIGRIAPRPVARGLWARTRLAAGRRITDTTVDFARSFREPRSLIRLSAERFLLAEIGQVLIVDAEGRIEKEFRHPYFGFLHSLDYHPHNGTFLAVSSGYDCLIEIDLETGNETWAWYSWDHGFTALDGTVLCKDEARAQMLQQQGRKALYIDPEQYGEQGIFTAFRANHPNSACYHCHRCGAILATFGHNGHLVEIDRKTGTSRCVLGTLAPMPHGIQPCGDGWMVTNTLCAEIWLLERDFRPAVVFRLSGLPDKVPEAGEHEWLQYGCRLNDGRFIAADANRGLVVFDPGRCEFGILECDPQWCIHFILPETQD